MKKHVDLSLKDPEKNFKSILEDIINNISNIDETLMYKRKYIHSDGLDESALSGDDIDQEELKKTLEYHNNRYSKKGKLGAKVAKLIQKNGIHPDSLIPEHKEALHLHLKKRVMN